MTHRGRRLVLSVLAGLALALLAAGPARAVITGTTWFPIGPAPSCCVFPGGEAGRATSVAVNPANFFEIWIGTANGGVWRSTDQAATWTALSDDQASLAIGSLALADCTDLGCDRVYAGTGENAIRRDTYYGRGLLVGQRQSLSGGGGMLWTLRTGTPYNFGRGSIYNVVLDPTTGGTSRRIFVALSSGVTASATESTVTAPQLVVSSNGSTAFKSYVDYGLYKSENDGVLWTKLTVAGISGDRPTDLEMDPANHNILYAGFLGKGLFKSVNNGIDWCPLSPGFPRGLCPVASGLPDHAAVDFDHVEVAIDPSNTSHLYASFGHCDDPILQHCRPSIYESSDAGLNWSLRYQGGAAIADSTDCPAAYSRYTHALTVYPADAGTLYLGGIHLCKSIDHGANWSEADANTLGGSTHLDHHAVLFDAVGFRGYDVNDGGVALWQYPGTTWAPKNQGMQTLAFQGIAVSPRTARVLGGMQDNGGALWTGAKQWDRMPCCGDGGFSVMDSLDPLKMWITSNVGPTSNTSVVPMRSTTGGAFFAGASNGIPYAEPRSFYPPMIQVAGSGTSGSSTLYFGTQRLWSSTDDGGNWSPVSPVLSSASEPEIVWGQDVITAIAVAPSDPTRIYVGYYSGRVFATDGACDLPSCWFEMDIGLPPAPVTSIAVNPTNKENVYATFSGFFSGGHVFSKTQFTVSWFATGLISELSGVPANWITLEPGAPQRLWLGTDKGLYKSTNAGGTWSKFGTGMPNAPVYQIAIDATRQRVVAATHGRGAYLLTGPSLEAYGGCQNNFVYDLTVYGTGFNPGHFCNMKLLRQDSSVCASGPIDANGGTIETDNSGVLATWKTGQWADDPGLYGCLHGKCLSNIDASKCNVPGNPLSAVVAVCDNQVAFAQVPGCPILSGPPSSWLSLTGQGGGFAGPGADARDGGSPDGPASVAEGAGRAEVDPKLPTGDSFNLQPTLQANDGTTRRLCSVNVPYAAGDTPTMILEHARDALNADPTCLLAGVSAAIQAAQVENEAEDLFQHPGNLVLSAPTLTGSQLVPSVQKSPGPQQGPCFEFGALGVPVQNQLRLMRLGIQTGPTGAAGGSLSITESSSLGDCTVDVPTSPGQTADIVASSIEAAFANPDPIQCPSPNNPHDVKRVSGGLILVMSIGGRVCLNDTGVGMTMAPAETCFANADCDDSNPCTNDTCNTATGQCQHTNVPIFTPCDDQNPCTTGNRCVGGTCGGAVVCNDSNPCTEDACDPATGACVSTPLQCDDGNPCTSDFCNIDQGRCVSFPIVGGGTCDDGNACTTGDFCDQPPGGGTPFCHGVDACDDGNPCTADTCDPVTGACSNAAIQCDDGNPCTTDTCAAATGTCVFTPTPNAPCDDADLCTQDDHCVQVVAGGDISCQGTPRTCDDGSLCTTDSCDPGTGQCLFVMKQCDDGQGCTDDVCVATSGQCVHVPRNCDDQNACTADLCDPQACVVPDHGGTADLLPASCPYGSVDDLQILNGLPPGTAIVISASGAFTCPAATPGICSFPLPLPGADCSQGAPASGEQDCAAATLSLHLAGTGTLLGFVRNIPLAVEAQVQFDPRTPGSPVQSFNASLFRLQGQLSADPDFSLLRITAGTDFGLPSPGHTTLTQSGGNWLVDSFFDMTYRIDYIGAPSGPLAGFSGSTTGTARIRTGAGACVHVPVNCDDQNACTVDSCDPAVGTCTHAPVSCDDGNACTADSCDPVLGCQHQPIATGEPSPATFQSQFQVIWPASPNATHWNTYRGTIPAGMQGSRPAASRYDQVCFESANAFGDGPTLTTDDAVPPIGQAFYYLISGEGPCGESPIGHDSLGAANPNSSPCPTPP